MHLYRCNCGRSERNGEKHERKNLLFHRPPGHPGPGAAGAGGRIGTNAAAAHRRRDALFRCGRGAGVRHPGRRDGAAAERGIPRRAAHPGAALPGPDPWLERSGRAPLSGNSEPGRQGGLHRRTLFPRLHAPAQPPSGGQQLRLRGLLHPPDRGQRLHGTVCPAAGAAAGDAGGGEAGPLAPAAHLPYNEGERTAPWGGPKRRQP